MEKFERFPEEKNASLRARYRGDDLFRTWTWLLCLLEQQLNGLNAVEIWSETEMMAQVRKSVDCPPDMLTKRSSSHGTCFPIKSSTFASDDGAYRQCPYPDEHHPRRS